MEKDYLILKRAAVSRPSGQWSDDDFDVLAETALLLAASSKANAAPIRFAVDVDASVRAP
jgi:hypothetical protein